MTDQIKQTALNLLARRDHSRTELVRKLKTKGYNSDAISDAVSELAESGYLNEHRFVERYIESRREKGFGPDRIAQELSGNKGVPQEVVANLIDFTDNAWFAAARQVWKKHFKNKLPSDFEMKVKQMNFLKYRGFTHEQIESVFEDDSCYTDDFSFDIN